MDDFNQLPKLEEFSLTDFTSRPDFAQASELTRNYSLERRGIMGTAPTTTKLVNIKIEKDLDYVTFYFLTEATEKYGPDYEYKDVLPDQNFRLERDPSKLYEIQLRFYKYSDFIKQPQLTQILAKQWLWSTDFAIWSNAPSFHWQGFNYNLSKLGASIHPTNIAPHVWNHYHGNALIDKHLFDLFINIKFFINQMASSVLNASRVGKRKHKKIDINPPAGKPPVGPGASEPLAVPVAPEDQSTVQPEPEEKPVMQQPEPNDVDIEGENPEDSLLPEPTMESNEITLRNKINETSNKALNILNEIEPQHRLDEVWIDFDSSDALLYISSVLEHKYTKAREITGWTREQVRGMNVKDMVQLAFRAIGAGPSRQAEYAPALEKACTIIKDVYLYAKDFPGIQSPSTFDGHSPNTVDVRIGVFQVAKQNNIPAHYAGQVIYVNKARMKNARKIEKLDLRNSAKLEWTKDAMGAGFKFDINGDTFEAFFDDTADIAAKTLMDYSSSQDSFTYNFPIRIDWRTRKEYYDVISHAHEVNFYFDNANADTGAGRMLTGRGNVGLIFNTVANGVVEFLNSTDHQNIDIITFECEVDSSARPKIYQRLADSLIQMFDYNYVLVTATSRTGKHVVFMLLSDNLYHDTFGSFSLSEAAREDGEENHGKGRHDDPRGHTEKNTKEDSKVVCALSSFNPPTADHRKLLHKVVASAKSLHADNIVYILSDSGYHQDRLSIQQKAHVLMDMTHGVNIELDNPVSNPYAALVDLYNRDYTEVYLLVGSDQVKEYQELVDTNNGIKTTQGYFKFETCKVVSYGYPNPDKGIDATRARNAVANNDFTSFEKSLQIPVFGTTKMLYNIMRYELSKSVGI
jgi:hypothetical protein